MEDSGEALEGCARLFHTSRVRASTDNIALAQRPSGLSLVQVGSAAWPEFAAWRYGAAMARRFRRTMARGVAGAGGSALLYYFGVFSTVFSMPGVAMVAPFAMLGWSGWNMYAGARRPVWRVPVGPSQSAMLRYKHVRDAELSGDEQDGWCLMVSHDAGESVLRSSDAVQGLSAITAYANGAVGSPGRSRRAAELIGEAGGPERIFSRYASSELGGRGRGGTSQVVMKNSWVNLLALEMASREEVERRAMGGELALLEREWKAAEEIAGTVDGL
jgi:hypothetical protein